MAPTRRRSTWFWILFLAVAFQGITPDACTVVSTVGFRLLIQLMGACDDWDLTQDTIEVVSGLAARKASHVTARRDQGPLEIIPSIRHIMMLSGASYASACCCGSIEPSDDRLSALGRLRC
jgi:hypothetical protein